MLVNSISLDVHVKTYLKSRCLRLVLPKARLSKKYALWIWSGYG